MYPLINLNPEICNICYGEVIYTTNDKVYGKRYGSGYCYFCTSCKAYVGTHKPRPKEALGLLANKEMRNMRSRCHYLFDQFWEGKNKQTRESAYAKLAQALGIELADCHFGYFNLEQLKKAYDIISRWYKFK